MRGTIAERFWAKVVKTEGCWLWTGSKHPSGHGYLYAGRIPAKAHRVSWEIHRGPIPPGLFVLHSCDTPPCVRPDHLYLGTHADNMRDFRNRSDRHRGERHELAKLSPTSVRAARARCAAGASITALAREYGVNLATLQNAVSGKTWRHVT